MGGRDEVALGMSVDVRGWPKLPTTDQANWMRHYSDHGLLYFEVEKG